MCTVYRVLCVQCIKYYVYSVYSTTCTVYMVLRIQCIKHYVYSIYSTTCTGSVRAASTSCMQSGTSDCGNELVLFQVLLARARWGRRYNNHPPLSPVVTAAFCASKLVLGIRLAASTIVCGSTEETEPWLKCTCRG